MCVFAVEMGIGTAKRNPSGSHTHMPTENMYELAMKSRLSIFGGDKFSFTQVQ